MASNKNDHEKEENPKSSSSTSSDIKQVDISKYFNNTTHTIFDEIVTPNNDKDFSRSESTMMNQDIPCNVFNMNSFLDDNHFQEYITTNDLARDTWIPSENTRKILRSIVTSTSKSDSIDKDNLTMPGLTIQGDMTDQLKDTAIHLLGEDENIHRNVLTANDVTQDERGLRNLIQAGCYRAAINLSGRLLSIYAQGYGKMNQPSKHTPHSLQLWYTRLGLLAKLKQHDILESESKPFGNLDKPDMYFTFYPELYGTKPGSMASFAFRLLLAEIPLHCGKPKLALDNLHGVLATVEKIIKNWESGVTSEGICKKVTSEEQIDALKLWKARKSRVLISIVNTAVALKNYPLGIEILENLCKLPDWNKEQLEILRSAIGRIYLLFGDVVAAETMLITDKDKSETPSKLRDSIDRGLMAVAQNSFQEAYNCFQAASTLDPSNVMLTNNMAVCLLYSGQLTSAVHLYENTISRNFVKSLQEPFVWNMCTSYELHTTHSKQTKLHLLRQLNRYKGDAIDIQCLKLMTK